MADPTAVLDAHEKYALPLAFSAASDSLVTGGFDGSLKRWQVGDGTQLDGVSGHEQSLNCGAITATGVLVTGSTDTTVRTWTLEGLTEQHTFSGHRKTVADLAAHPDRSLVASASYDTTVMLWDLETDTVAGVFEEHPNNVTRVSFVGDSEYIVSGGLGSEAIVWAITEPEPVARLPDHQTAVTGIESPANDQLWTSDYGGWIRRWDTSDWSPQTEFSVSSGATLSGFASHPTQDLFAVTMDYGCTIVDGDGSVIRDHEFDIKGVYEPQWSPDGNWLAVGGADGRIRLFHEP